MLLLSDTKLHDYQRCDKTYAVVIVTLSRNRKNS